MPAHVGAQKRGSGLPDVTEPTVDLFAAETGALLAWTDYLMGERLDAVHPLVRERLRLEVDRRILTPALERDDFWWMGFSPREVNNWNPWINSNWLASVLLLERDPERRVRAVRKIARSLDRFVDAYPDDGGCDEGPSYWGRAGASLFESLELLHAATGGRIDVYREPVVRAIGQYIARAYIAGRLLREHRRRAGEGAAGAGARVPVRPRGGGRVPRRRSGPSWPPAAGPTGRTTSRATAAWRASCRRCCGWATSRPRPRRSRSTARSGSRTCR